MSDHRDRPEVDILSVTDTSRRRRWTDTQKVRIVDESFGPRGSMAETARRHDIDKVFKHL
jgi:transposase